MAIVQLANLRRFEAAPGSVLLDAAAVAGLTLEHSCRTGRCGSCRARVSSGTTTVLRPETGLSERDAQEGWILTCARGAESDLSLAIDDLGALAALPVRTLPCRIDTIERPAVDIVRVRLRLPPSAAMRWRAGQSIDVMGPGGVRRSYSIANAAGPIELLIRRVEGGLLSRYWFEQARAGDLLRFEGPRGSFHLRDAAGLDLVFLATGTGIAPVKAMLEELATREAPAQPRSIRLLWGGRSEADLFWTPPTIAGLNYRPVLSRAATGWSGARGHVQDAVLRDPPDWPRTAIYACGSPAMIEDARRVLPAHRFYSDAFVASTPMEEALA